MAQTLTELELGKLRWRCRRGLLENDLFLERFFNKHAHTLQVDDATALYNLMDLSDNDLLDLNLGRKTLQDIAPHLDTPLGQKIITLLKEKT